ncbi:transcriptional regulator, TetR family [Halobacillus alkaliphilus]|uniref:Transcriptional regulator, TetR family n=1 Tax=Halobacillus alkaliphilus TaxID=396056 RepID=A0A1I2Q2J5_9BACI|nr:TetR family transcriptional regulator [Halobacillus alkaliphilus]SFG21903.1 transcriptional regulator, TetR family [Halobacillus alkaliphilus]
MPKKTFFNLPEDKKQSLVEACRIEFSRVPLHEASISNMIKVCGISRGSFYQYFEDKEDAFYYLLKEKSKQRQETFILFLKETDGNIYEAVTKLFEVVMEEFEEEENRNFFKHVFLNMNHKIQNTFTNGETEDKFLQYLDDIKVHLDQSQFNTENDEEFYHAIHLIRMLMFNNIVRHFAKGLTKEEAMKNFTLELNLLKRGISS